MRLALALYGCLLSLGCGERDGVIGVQPRGSAAPAGFLDELETNAGRWEEQLRVPGATTSVGTADSAARDGYLASLRFPGHPDYDAAERVGPREATQLATRERFHFGVFRTRMAFGSCAETEDVVMAFFGFFNDGTDDDGDGIVDDLELNVQVTCSAPSQLFFTVFTDNDAQRFRKRSRRVDFERGELFDTVASDSDELAPAGTDPELALPAPFTEGQFQELGFEWREDRVRFFMSVGGAERTLWTLSGREQVPQRPVHIMYNAWHPETHWYPPYATAGYPASDVWMKVDWVSFTPE